MGVFWRYPAVFCARPVVRSRKSQRRGDAFVVPAQSALRLRSLTLTGWSSEPTTGTYGNRRRCARRVFPTCPHRHTLLSKRKKIPQQFSNFSLSAQNANLLLKRLLGPKAVHVSACKKESTRGLRNVYRVRLVQQTSCRFACSATQSSVLDPPPFYF